MPVKVRKTYDLEKMQRAIPREVAALVNQIAGLFVVDMKEGLQRGIDVDSRGFAPLDPKTISAKSRKGASRPTSPLIDTGMYLEGIHIKKQATPSNLTAIVKPPIGRGRARSGQRDIIMGYHNRGEGNLPRRKSWYVPGVDKMPRIRKELNRLLRQTDVKIVMSAHKGHV